MVNAVWGPTAAEELEQVKSVSDFASGIKDLPGVTIEKITFALRACTINGKEYGGPFARNKAALLTAFVGLLKYES